MGEAEEVERLGLPDASRCSLSGGVSPGSYLSTTRKNDVGALDALTRLFSDDPWMPPQAA